MWQGTEGGLWPRAIQDLRPSPIICEELNPADNHMSELGSISFHRQALSFTAAPANTLQPLRVHEMEDSEPQKMR